MSAFLFKACGLAVTSAMLIMLLRKWGAEHSLLLKVAAGIAMAAVCFGAVSPVVEYIRELGAMGEENGLADAVELMLRVLAVAIVTHVCATICRDCGEGTLASYVELGGKVEILILSLPMVKQIIDLSVGML